MTTAEAPTHLRETRTGSRDSSCDGWETFGIDPNLINVLERCKQSRSRSL